MKDAQVQATETSVREEVARLFVPEQQARAWSLVTAVQGQTVPVEAVWRIREAVVRLSEGNVNDLGHYVGVAVTDYRDVLWWAETA